MTDVRAMRLSARTRGLQQRSTTALLSLARPRVALWLALISLLLLVVSTVLPMLWRGTDGSYLWLAPYAAVGAVVANRQPRNPIGWIILTSSIVTMFAGDAGDYAVFVFRDGHASLPLGRLAVVVASGWIAFVVTLPVPILLFPDGRLPTGWWRLTVWLYLALIGLLIVQYVIGNLPAFTARHVVVDSTGELTKLDNSGFEGAAPVFALMIAWVVRQVVVYRTATGERRAQLKWLLSGGALAVGGFIVSSAVPQSSPVHITFMLVVALPIFMGVGIVRYRLYEIDRLVSRTLAYALLSALLAGVFIGLVALSTDVLPFSSTVGVAASTLAAAALFNPLRARVQRIVDRRFNRARYDAEATVAAFAAHLRDAVDLDAVQAELLSTVSRALQPAHATVWIRRQGAAAGEATRR